MSIGTNLAPTAGVTTDTRQRALELLGAGTSISSVANTLGVTEARISQLLSEDAFHTEVVRLRYENLNRFNARDAEYDALEDTLLERMKGAIEIMFKPREILMALKVINEAKRRGASSPSSIEATAPSHQLILPSKIVNHFTQNVHNQVIQVTSSSPETGEKNTQELLTIPSGMLSSLISSRTLSQGEPEMLENQNGNESERARSNDRQIS